MIRNAFDQLHREEMRRQDQLDKLKEEMAEDSKLIWDARCQHDEVLEREVDDD